MSHFKDRLLTEFSLHYTISTMLMMRKLPLRELSFEIS